MADYKLNFKDMKCHVGIDDVAYSLGYRLDRKAGVGRYIELVLGSGNEKRDTIIVSNHRDKSAQTFFRRDGSKGDVVTFIKENLNQFSVEGKDDWQKVAKVMANFANMPVPDYSDRNFVKTAKETLKFNPDRYDAKPVNLEYIPIIFSQRGITAGTVGKFAPFISIVRDLGNPNFKGFNIGFPYTDPVSGSIVGYELRGLNGFKSKAAGTNSSSAAWIADLSHGDCMNVSNVFFFESAFDAMAFYQLNRLKLGDDIALVSLGGSFSDNQVRGILQKFPNARANDCFDNDLAGRVNGLRLISIVENIPLKIQKHDSGLKVATKDKSFILDADRPLYAELDKFISVRHKIGRSVPPSNFKDWNDCLMGNRLKPDFSPDKHDRNENLSNQRKSSFKL